MVENLDPQEYTPTRAEANEITERNEKYVEKSNVEIMISNYYRAPESYEIGESVTMSEILNTLTINRVPGLNQSTLGNALKRMGIKKKRYASGQRYYVYKVKQDQLDEEAKRIGQEEYNKGIEEAQKRREAGEDVPF